MPSPESSRCRVRRRLSAVPSTGRSRPISSRTRSPTTAWDSLSGGTTTSSCPVRRARTPTSSCRSTLITDLEHPCQHESHIAGSKPAMPSARVQLRRDHGGPHDCRPDPSRLRHRGDQRPRPQLAALRPEGQSRRPGDTTAGLGLTGTETYQVAGLGSHADKPPETVTVTADDVVFTAVVRLDTAREAAYYRHGGVLPYVLRTVRAT